MSSVAARLIALAMLLAAAPAGAAIKQVSAQVIACQNEATQRYIADIRQVGPPQQRFDEFPIVVTQFQNASPRFEEYVRECMSRGDRDAAAR